MYPVTLDGERVHLRELDLADVDNVAAIIGDPQVTQWLSFDTRTRDQAQAMVEGVTSRAQQDPRTEYYLGVTVRPYTTVIGFVRLALGAHRGAKLGYAIAHPYWDNGYATDAVGAMLAFGFEQLDLHRVTAAIGPQNLASMAVVRRHGFMHEGVLHEHVFTNGAWRDSVLWAMLEHQWAARQKPRAKVG